MLTILDKYIIKKFLGTFIFIQVLIMAIAVVFDVSEKIDDFLDSNATFYEIIVRYYINFVLYYSNLFSSLLIFISAILFTSKMAQRSEIIAILASGVSFRRLLRPYFISGLFLTGLAMILNHFFIPYANKGLNSFMEEHMWNTYRILERNMHREMVPGTIVYAESINLDYNVVYQFSLENWEDGKLTKKLIADRAIFLEEDSVWSIKNYFIRDFLPDGSEIIERGFAKDTVMNLHINDFGQRLTIAATLDYYQLNEYIEKERLKGSNKVPYLLIEKHQRTSYPVATFVLILIAVSLSSRKSRGGTGLHLALGIVSAVTYIFLMKITSVATTNAGLNPFISVWIPNILFGLYAIYLYRKAPK